MVAYTEEQERAIDHEMVKASLRRQNTWDAFEELCEMERYDAAHFGGEELEALALEPAFPF